MSTTTVRTGTARRMWALPGAMLRLPLPEFRDGGLVISDRTGLIPCPSFLIEHDRGLVLFDTGVSPKGLADPVGYYGEAMTSRFELQIRPDLAIDAQLKGLGYGPKHVGRVIPSHLHFDHAGGLYLFPDATFLIGAGERQYAERSGARSFIPEDLIPTRGFTWIEMPGDHDVFGDGSVVVIRAPGHTPGELALLVRLPNRELILTGDACHFRVEMEHGMAAPGMFMPDAAAEAANSIKRLRALREEHGADVWIGHDADDWAKWPHAPEHID